MLHGSNARHRAAGPRPQASRDGLWVAGVMLAGLILRLWLATRNAGITMDSPTYVRMAEELLGGVRDPEAYVHLGYPALIALASRALPGRELPGRAVSLLMGLAVIALTYALARTRLSARWSSLAAGLVALHPLIAVYSGVIMSETTFQALTYGALFLVERRQSARGGALAGIAYWVRPEALGLAAGTALFGRAGRRGTLLFLLAFVIATLPYLAYLRWERGSWVLSPKTALVRPPPASRAEIEFHLPSTGAVSAPPQTPAGLARWDVPALEAHYLPNLRRHALNLVDAWPWPLIALSVVGVACRHRALLAPLLILPGLPLVDVIFDPRFVLVMLPALAIFAAEGGAWLSAHGRGLLPGAAGGRALPAATTLIATAGLAWCWMGPNLVEALVFDDGPMPELRAAGAWLQANGRAGATVMDRKAYVPFFAGMRHAQIPDNDYDTIVEWARRSGADYLVVEEYVMRSLRPQLARLVLDPQFRARESRLRLLYSWRESVDSGVAIFEVVRDSVPGPPPRAGSAPVRVGEPR